MNYVVPILRAAVQTALAVVAAYLFVHFGLTVSPDVQVEVGSILVPILAGLIAKGQHLLEKRFPRLGALLHTPTYPPELKAAIYNEEQAAFDRLMRRLTHPLLYGTYATTPATTPSTPPTPEPPGPQ